MEKIKIIMIIMIIMQKVREVNDLIENDVLFMHTYKCTRIN